MKTDRFIPTLVLLASLARAADQTWIQGNANNDWNTSTGLNWDAGVAWTQNNSAIFGGTGETVTLTEGISVDGLTFNVAGYTINGNTLTLGASTINAAANATINSILAGGSLSKTGTGTLTLGGANSYSGGTTWADGSLTITNGSAFGTGALSITKTTTGTLTVANTAATTVANAITLPAPGAAATYTVIKNSPGQLTGTVLNLTGDITGGNANTTLYLNSNVGGDSTTTYRFAGNNTFRATFNLNRGAIAVGSATGLGDTANLVYLNSNPNATSGNLRFELPMTLANPVQIAWDGMAVNTDVHDVVFSGVLSGTEDVVKLGAGKLTLNNAGNTHSGAVTISAGTVELSGAGRLNSGTHAGVIVNNGALVIGTSATQTLNGAMSGAGAFSKTGGGILNLGSAASSFSGGITITAGQVRATATSAGATGSLGTGPISIANGAALHFHVPTGTTSTFANNIQLPATGSQQFIVSGPSSATTVRLTGQLTGGTAGQTFRLADSGVSGNHNNILILDNPSNSFSGTIEMWRGTLGFTSDAALGNVDNDIRHYTENLNGSLRFDADNITLNSSRTITLVSTNVMPFNTQTFSGTIAGTITGPGQLVKQGSGTLTLTGANTYAGTTTLSAGILRLGDGGAGGTLGSGPVVNNAGLSFNRSNTLTVANPVSGTGTLTQEGAGTTILAGSNSYQGVTTVRQGTLLISGSTHASGQIVVAAGATLGGGGSGGVATLADTAVLAPGDAAGNHLFLSELTLADQTILRFDLDAALATSFDTTPAYYSDHVALTGALTLDGRLRVNALANFPAAPALGDTWLLFSHASGGLTDHTLVLDEANSTGLPAAPLNAHYEINTTTQPGFVYLAVVPEPAVSSLLGVGLLALFLRRRAI